MALSIQNFAQIKSGAANNLKHALELKKLVQEVLARFENLNIIDQASVERARVRDEANEKIKSLVADSSAVDEMNMPGTSKSKDTSELQLTEKERKKQEMLKVSQIF